MPDGETFNSGRRPAVTLADVASLVGVSARTVSRVVNGEGGYNAETRDRILAAIDTAGYRPNLIARGLMKRRSDTIGLVVAEMLDPFFPEFAEGVTRSATAIGRILFLASTDSDPKRQDQALRSLHGHGVDGVIVFAAPSTEADLARFAALGLPIVVVSTAIEAPGIANVAADIYGGARLAVEHLLAGGRQRIAFVATSIALRAPITGRRELGYRHALAEGGVDVDESLIIETDNTSAGGRAAVTRLMALPHPPDAVFAYNDVLALGALQQLLTQGFAVPDDVAVVGFDDIAMCDVVTPRLSSVRIDRDLLGHRAVAALQALRDNPNSVGPTTIIPVELIHRDSS